MFVVTARTGVFSLKEVLLMHLCLLWHSLPAWNIGEKFNHCVSLKGSSCVIAKCARPTPPLCLCLCFSPLATRHWFRLCLYCHELSFVQWSSLSCYSHVQGVCSWNSQNNGVVLCNWLQDLQCLGKWYKVGYTHEMLISDLRTQQMQRLKNL